MQPFGRPVARAARVHGCRLLVPELAALVAWRSGGGRRSPVMQTPRCSGRPIAARARLYSTQGPPPRDSAEGRSAESGPAADPLSSAVSSRLPSAVESRRSALNQKFSHVMDNVQARVLTASHALNDITGYSAIEAIKADNERLEARLAAAQAQVRSARLAYKTSNTKRATTQREVTTLLARKDTWSPADLERFTQLYRTDHVLEGEVAGAQEALTEAEAEEQSLSQRLNAGILKRYHEEQIWSDRIRRASTWGTWGLVGMNFVLFVVLQFVAEPWRRRRLVKGVVEEEKGLLQEVRDELAAVKLGLERRDEPPPPPPPRRSQTDGEAGLAEVTPAEVTPAVGDTVPEAARATWRETLTQPARWKAAAADLYSERRVHLRMRDASMLALEGALAGAAVAGGVAVLLMRQI